MEEINPMPRNPPFAPFADINKVVYMNNHRRQMLYQKTDFSHHHIRHLPNVFKCCKCRKHNTIMVELTSPVQLCVFCGTPNHTKRS